MATFPADQLERIDKRQEVEIETHAADGTVHRVTIWAVVDDGEVFVRSVRGPTARWYRELLRDGTGVLRVGEEHIPVRATQTPDDASVSRTSQALQRKYEGDPAVWAMIREDVLETTVRLEAA
jgi:hypothetical protein